MKKIVFVVWLITVGIAPVRAQSLSIAQLFDKLEESLSFQQDELNTRIAQEGYKEVLTNRIPVFYVDANIQRNLIIPTTPVPAIAFDPTAPDGAIIPLKFATKWSSKAGIQLEWNLFDPKRKANEQEQKLNVEKARLQAKEHAQDWQRDAALAYASVVLATQQYELALQDSTTYAEILDVYRARYEAGRGTRADYLAAQQEFERKKIQRHEAWGVLVEADLELRRYVDLDGVIHLDTDIPGVVAFLEPRQSVNFTLQSLELDRQLTQIQQQSLRRQLLPSLSVNAYIGEQYFSNQLRLAQQDQWFGNSFVNLALRLPLSTYFTASPTLRKLAYTDQLQVKQIAQEQLEDRIDQQQQQSRLQTARHKLSMLQQIEKLALQAKDEKHAAFLAGRVLLSEYNEALLLHTKAHQDVWQAEYDLIELLLD